MAQDTKKKLTDIISYLNVNKTYLAKAKEYVSDINDPELNKKFEAADTATNDVVKYIESRIDHPAQKK